MIRESDRNERRVVYANDDFSELCLSRSRRVRSPQLLWSIPRAPLLSVGPIVVVEGIQRDNSSRNEMNERRERPEHGKRRRKNKDLRSRRGFSSEPFPLRTTGEFHCPRVSSSSRRAPRASPRPQACLDFATLRRIVSDPRFDLH